MKPKSNKFPYSPLICYQQTSSYFLFKITSTPTQWQSYRSLNTALVSETIFQLILAHLFDGLLVGNDSSCVANSGSILLSMCCESLGSAVFHQKTTGPDPLVLISPNHLNIEATP